MNLCPECSKSPWPFAMVFFLTSVCSFITWLTLSFSQIGVVGQIAGSALMFIAVGGTLLHYVITCMKRHCRHEQGQAPGLHHHHGEAN